MLKTKNKNNKTKQCFFFFFQNTHRGKEQGKKYQNGTRVHLWLAPDPFSISASVLPFWNDHILLSQRDRPSWRAEKGSRVSILSSGLSPSRFHLSLPALCPPRLSGSSALDGVRCPGSAGAVSTRDRAQWGGGSWAPPGQGAWAFPPCPPAVQMRCSDNTCQSEPSGKELPPERLRRVAPALRPGSGQKQPDRR